LLTRNHRQEALSRAYVEIVAAQCGMACISPRLHDYGIDFTLREIWRRGRRRCESGFSLDVQAKSTSVGNLTDSEVLYDLAVKNYDDLREPTLGSPRILVVLVLPKAEKQWSTQTEEQLTLRYCAYWMSLLGQSQTPNRRTVRIAIPRTNVFSATALPLVVDRIKKGELL
jgi:Domain of unknown function (DUF4365)